MDPKFLDHLSEELSHIQEAGLFKTERVIASPQSGEIALADDSHVLNFCANNYLGLADHPKVVEAAIEGASRYGFGMASVRFICGTQTVHIELEERISSFLKTEGTILYSSCFDANGGLFETLLGPEDAIISDQLNHASIIDGVRLCKAKRFRYLNNDMTDLEEKLKMAEDCRFKMIATDGVFSMDGIIANLSQICDLAEKYNAIVMFDDCHATGFLGENGRGTHEYCEVIERVDLITGTLGKALGGASGGYTSGKQVIIDFLRQRSRPYLFSNALCPIIAHASMTIFDLLETEGVALRHQLNENAKYFREKMTALGFQLAGADHPIIPVMTYDAKLTQEFAKRMLDLGIYVIGFFYPVVPKEKARIRTQMSAAHTRQDLDQAIDAFEKVGLELGVIQGARS